MSHNDPAVWKRVRIVDFPITFLDNLSQPNEQKIDRTLKTKIKEDVNYQKEFMLMLLDWYKNLYLMKGLSKPPNSVLRATQEYQEESVQIAKYWGECITMAPPSAHTHLCLQCIFDDFSWRDPNKAKGYTEDELKGDLASIGVIINKAKTRCSNCPKSRHAVKNCRFSDERIRERGENRQDDGI